VHYCRWSCISGESVFSLFIGSRGLVHCYQSLGCLAASLLASRFIYICSESQKKLSCVFEIRLHALTVLLMLLTPRAAGLLKRNRERADHNAREIHSGRRHLILNFEHPQRAESDSDLDIFTNDGRLVRAHSNATI
jgi:hypothetical protein